MQIIWLMNNSSGYVLITGSSEWSDSYNYRFLWLTLPSIFLSAWFCFFDDQARFSGFFTLSLQPKAQAARTFRSSIDNMPLRRILSFEVPHPRKHSERKLLRF